MWFFSSTYIFHRSSFSQIDIGLNYKSTTCYFFQCNLFFSLHTWNLILHVRMANSYWTANNNRWIMSRNSKAVINQGSSRDTLILCTIFNYLVMFASNCMTSYARLHVAILLIQYTEAGRIVWFGTRHAAIIVQMPGLYIERMNKTSQKHFCAQKLRSRLLLEWPYLLLRNITV